MKFKLVTAALVGVLMLGGCAAASTKEASDPASASASAPETAEPTATTETTKAAETAEATPIPDPQVTSADDAFTFEALPGVIAYPKNPSWTDNQVVGADYVEGDEALAYIRIYDASTYLPADVDPFAEIGMRVAEGWEYDDQVPGSNRAVAPVLIGGVEAPGYQFDIAHEGVVYRREMHLIRRGDQIYAMDISTTPENGALRDQHLAQIAASWAWK